MAVVVASFKKKEVHRSDGAGACVATSYVIGGTDVGADGGGYLSVEFKVCLAGLLGEVVCAFFFSSRRRHTSSDRDWSSDVCSSDLADDAERAALAKGKRDVLGG